MTQFSFNPKKHQYTLNDELVPGVTTILGTLAKPMLIQWAANMAIEYIRKTADPVDIEAGFDLEVWDKLLEKARTAHAQKRDSAGDKGKELHAHVEHYIKTCIREFDGLPSPLAVPEISLFVLWAQKNKVRFFESEKAVYSLSEKFAGTADFTCEIDGKRMVGDLKTTSGIYDLTPFLQCAAYRFCLQEMGETNFVGSVIVRLGKDGSFEEFYRYDETGEDMETFLSLLKVYRAITRFKNQNKK